MSRERKNNETTNTTVQKWVKYCIILLDTNTVDLVIFAKLQFSQILRGGQIREFKSRENYYYNSAAEEK